MSLGFPEKGNRLAEESRAILQDRNAPQEILLAFTSLLRASTYLTLTQDQYVELRQVAQAGLKIARGSGDQWHVAMFLYWAGQYARLQKQYKQAAQTGEKGLAIAERLGESWLIASFFSLLLGTVEYECGSYLEARRRFEQGLRYFKETGQPWTIAVSYGHLGNVAAALRDFPEAECCYRKRLKIFGESDGQLWETSARCSA